MRYQTTMLGGLLAGMMLSAAAGVARADDAATQGYLYGTVETQGGKSYTGVLRWGHEEAFWDDLYNASKVDRPEVPGEARREGRGKRIEVFGVPIWVTSEASGGRQFVMRFGDLAELRVRDGDLEAVLRGGQAMRLNDGSNDQSADIHIQDATLGEVTVPWGKVATVRFAATPAGVGPLPARLYGRVKTKAGVFEGFIQWDSEECLASDKLDGDTEDGRLSIEMGRLRAIEKHDDDGSWVELKDGRKLLLEGTNDVDSSLRGVLVETERSGRIEISWEAFERIDFIDGKGSGRGYESYEKTRPLAGRVTSKKGETLGGELVFDLDESYACELLNGSLDGVEYSIPFARVKAIAPRPKGLAAVTLVDGGELMLGEATDVDDDNAGVLVRAAGKETLVSWDEVARIEFDR